LPGQPATLTFVVDLADFFFLFGFSLQGGVVDRKVVAQIFGDLVKKRVIAPLHQDKGQVQGGAEGKGAAEVGRGVAMAMAVMIVLMILFHMGHSPSPGAAHP
jgi:hypothetical protein